MQKAANMDGRGVCVVTSFAISAHLNTFTVFFNRIN
jgi:hypothetical protein